MDRQIVYIGQIPQDTDQLQQNKNTMIGLGYALQAILGTNTAVDGLACTPNSPAAMNVLVGPGSIYSLQNVDGTAYGSLAPDTTDQIVKQGLIMTTTTLACPAPATTGQSVVYLVEVAYQDTDSGSTVLPYYNAANPSVAWSGPSNSGVSQNTVRRGVCTVAVKTGVAATTGTQVAPSPDAGYTGLYAITVANGQTTITSGNIQTLATAPFIGTKLPNILTAIQQDKPNYALDTSGAANTINVTLSPATSSLTDGLVVRVKVANSSTGPTVMNVDGHGNVACNTMSGAAFTTNTVVANGIHTFVYDANGTRFQLQGFTATTATGLLPANNLSDVSSAATSRTNLGLGLDGTNFTTGSGNLAFGSAPVLPSAATATTQSPGNNSTHISTTAYADAAVAAGKVFVGYGISTVTAHTAYTGVTLIPFDDTIPQSNEGVQWGSVTYTPTNASNRLLIRATVHVGESSNNQDAFAQSLFQDSNANALSASITGLASLPADAYPQVLITECEMTAGTTSATTFKARVSGDTGATLDVNGVGGARLFGGVLISKIEVFEFTP